MVTTTPGPADGPPRIRRASLCGVGDEAGYSLRAQIDAHLALGWSQMELRSVGGLRLGRLDETAVAGLVDELGEAGLRVPVLASTIGDWSSTIARDFAGDVEELGRLLTMAERLAAPFIRIMSYPAGDTPEPAWGVEVRRRVVELARRAAERGIVLLHENCHGWAAQDPENALALIDATDGRGLRLLFDVGNPIAHGYDGIGYLHRVLPWVAHLHVKDAVALPDGGAAFLMPGEGNALVLDCIDLVWSSGYSGALSIEPHVAVRPHEGVRAPEDELAEAYVAYGRRFMALLGDRLSARGEIS
jgi:sugar phosphate isomerase/epimerase